MAPIDAATHRKAREALEILDYEPISTELGPAYRVGDKVVVLNFANETPTLESVVGIGYMDGRSVMDSSYVYVLRRLDSRQAGLTIVAQEILTKAPKFVPGEWLTVCPLGVKLPLQVEDSRRSDNAAAWEYTLFGASDDWILESKLLEMGAV